MEFIIIFLIGVGIYLLFHLSTLLTFLTMTTAAVLVVLGSYLLVYPALLMYAVLIGVPAILIWLVVKIKRKIVKMIR